MSLKAAWQARISAPSRPELEQAILRITVLSIVTLYVLWFVNRHAPPWLEDQKILVAGLAGWLVLAMGIFAAVWTWPAANGPRRFLGMLADVGAITFGLFLAGSLGAFLVSLYLLIIFGNGFRYGRAYLHVCQFLCLTGLVLVVSMVPWWQYEREVAAGWMISIVVLPLYVAVLAGRIDAARVKAEEALKECVERERRGS
jgi:two-component system sensor histidine kinase RpfC